jgi:hypothetical protein
MSTEEKTSRLPLVISLVVGGMGAFVVLAALGIIPASEESFNAPRWVVGLMGLVFMAAGMAVLVNYAGSTGFLSPSLRKMGANFLIAVLLSGFGLVFSWIAFGPGPREFSGGVSLLFIQVRGLTGGELVGRVVFGVFAVIVDLLALWRWTKVIGDVVAEIVERLSS